MEKPSRGHENRRSHLLAELAAMDWSETAKAPSEASIPKTALVAVARGGKKSSQLVKKRGKGKVTARVVAQAMITRMEPGSLFPPAYNAIPTYRVKRRFVSAEDVAISSSQFQLRHGHNQFMVATDSSTLLPYAEMWRIRKISVWALNYVDNATTVTIFPTGTDIDTNNFNDRERAFACSSRSEAEPGHMAIVPARDTPLGSWHKTSTVNSTGSLFVINVDYGGASSGNWATVTLDIDFELVLNTFGLPQGYTRSVTGATVGTLYGADFPATSASLLLQSVNKI